jgi:hypothetical protein
MPSAGEPRQFGRGPAPPPGWGLMTTLDPKLAPTVPEFPHAATKRRSDRDWEAFAPRTGPSPNALYARAQGAADLVTRSV